ncbi:TetR/AcrR family transcriptional regulator [Amycolatopsis sp. 195334CR]|uniref:TetR/AcrR family transcriptional regulator n=1 Tax=Amycolatopsis sp. 195334CR TaxID=2814588 RepID=UPI001A8C6E68|nr:TetR/AcrR family transcriptional regulator [Amycolatopsis sp. 195334CR]MBN6041325.1 TetR/AcrR family transcriptional regulator [Amycolatopsis sp. 195334CR]
MVRLSRAELQEHNRAKVLRAAREEFAERGFREAKVDAIAERAELTRGAVYSNFPGKRALYFAVLAELAEQADAPPHAKPGRDLREALGALARTWVTRLPIADVGAPKTARLGVDLVSEVGSDEQLRRPFAQLMKLDGLLLGLAMERLQPPERPPGAPPRRLVRVAESVLTTLHGASRLAAAAPGFVEPFDVVSACEQLADLDLNDWWAAPSTPSTSREMSEPWAPQEVVDLVRGEAVSLDDGVVMVVGLHRLAAVEHAVRSSDGVTAVLVTSSPDELMPLARLTIAELASCVRSAFPAATWPPLRVVCDAPGTLAAAAGVHTIDDETEAAVRIEGGRIVARADGSGAGHAVASTLGKVAN